MRTDEEVSYIPQPVERFIQQKIRNLAEFEDDAFIVTDLSEVQARYEDWVGAFPDIQPFFALKSQNTLLTRQLLAANGCGFDVASIEEVRSVVELGVAPGDILYGQPYKQPSHLVYALKHGLVSVCDTVDEIRKIGEVAAKINTQSPPQILLRILPDDKEGDIKGKLSSKFGASISRLADLARTAKQNRILIKGISFHVGSHCHSAEPYLNTLKLSRCWWEELQGDWGCQLSLLDIGGGYPGERDSNFVDMARQINRGIAEHYGDIRSQLRVIAEPGRYMVTSSQSIVCNVIAEKEQTADGQSLVLNTGVYGGLSTSIWDRTAARGSLPYVVRREKEERLVNGEGKEERLVNGEGKEEEQNGEKDGEVPEGKLTLWGPTCDSSDRLIDGYRLPAVRRGDWLVFPNLGAYGSNIMTTFNGFEKPKMVFVCSRAHSDKVKKLLG